MSRINDALSQAKESRQNVKEDVAARGDKIRRTFRKGHAQADVAHVRRFVRSWLSRGIVILPIIPISAVLNER